MNEKLLAELRELAEEHELSANANVQSLVAGINDIIDRHEHKPDTTENKGEDNMHMMGVSGAQPHSPALPTKADKVESLEPKMGGLVCPYCSKVVSPPYKAASYLPEPLACLADKKDWWVTLMDGGKNWHIELQNKKKTELFEAPTYALCEAKARAFLSKLADKGGE